ncbi:MULTISPECIES: ABC transporter ATP-binding protein [Haloarcula]|uniref:ABC transporter ATP-binding protein n=4 Tax=Haloarcula TaxID=2237 RepID=A0A482T0W5_HALHI|nr:MULTISPECIES: ABC transporter ATP-binding protein [Haloarcula]AEM56776.1 ABC transporter ATP-binding protein [Haloarcula hispanica ATCC 33960]AHB65574.1 ABC transporter ATP-binding protein [Haloarcula hispanica N601]AJF26694.1 ABC transporter ATP-binding protein [Haloarcula sp. CBA1115]EMA21677.1 ABC transporter ATP-binding protein [Haloarcula amylolytica JCM 13557]KAA9409480.1 ABC transporter ATP-binding protein [Haloarcula hispanica]
MIDARDIRKEYGGFVAVQGSSFSVDRGEVFGIIGPNGAGKTTTLKMLAGLLEPTSGSAEIAGLDTETAEMRQQLGFLPEESPLYEEMTPISYLKFFADLYDVDPDVAEERMHDTLDELELEHRDRKLGDMSKGMKRKVAIARSLINDPDVLIYDEPASGLDPLTTNYVIEFTEQLAKEGKTIVFSAHNLFHVESICDRVVIMNEGEIVARGDLEQLQAEYGHTRYHVYTTVDVPGAAKENGTYERVVESMEAVETTRRQAENRGGDVVDIRTEESSLEEVFLNVAEAGTRGTRYVEEDAE